MLHHCEQCRHAGEHSDTEIAHALRQQMRLTQHLCVAADKRRAMASLSGPLRQDPKWRYRIGLDLRNENWDLLGAGNPAPLLGADTGAVLDPLLVPAAMPT